MTEISRHFSAKDIFIPLKEGDKFTVISDLVKFVTSNHTQLDYQKVLKKIIQREHDSSTGIGNGIAIPHCFAGNNETIVMGMGIFPRGIDFQALDKKLVNIIILIIASRDQRAAYLQLLARITKVLSEQTLFEFIVNSESIEQIYSRIIRADHLINRLK